MVLILFGIPVVVALPAIFPENKITSSVRCALLYSIIIICLLEMLQRNSLAAFTLTYLDMDRKSIYTCICLKTLVPAGSFSQHRIVVAVSKYDLYLKQSSDRRRRSKQGKQQQNQHDLRKEICDQIKASTGIECPREIIVPLSAEWAEQARELRQNPKDRELQEDVTQSLRMVPDSPRGQGEEAASTRPIVLSSQLEVSCGIMQLEER